MKVLVAGGTGVAGREVVRELAAAGHELRLLSRRGPSSPDGGAVSGSGAVSGPGTVSGDVLRPESLRGVCDGMDVVVSTVGGSLDIRKIRERTSYDRVDHRGNVALLDEARRAGVRRFVYLSVYPAEGTAALEYVAAHQRFEAALADSGLDHGIVRPTGFFAFLGDVVTMARRGRAVTIGDGSARTNPVHEADVAAAVAEAVAAAGVATIDVGGPDVVTRREIAEMAFRALGRAPRITTAPPGALRAAAGIFAPMNPRLSALLLFGTEVSLVDVVAPRRGTRRLEEYFGALASGQAAGGSGS